MRKDMIKVAYVTFDANCYPGNKNHGDEYVYQCPFDVVRDDIVIVNTRYGPSLARISSTNWVEADCVSTQHLCILSGPLHIPSMTQRAKETMDEVRYEASVIAEMEEKVKEQRKEVAKASKALNKLESALTFNENKLIALKKCR